MKFEHIIGTLCLMTEPVPLTEKAQFPCVVRLIQDDSQMGRYNQSYSEYRYGVRLGCCMLPIIATHIAKNGVVNDIEWDVNRYEILGYPVADGSAEWRNYQLMQGKCVCRPGDSEYYQASGQGRIIGKLIENNEFNSTWNSDTFMRDDSDSWQIYEPKPLPFEHVKKDDMILCSDGKERKVAYVSDKPDRLNPRLWFNLKDEYGVNTTYHLDGTMQSPASHPEVTYTLVKIAPKPLLADAKVGDLCQRRDGKWAQITWFDVEDKDSYKIGEGFYDLDGVCYGGNQPDIISTEPLAPEGSAEWALQMLLLGKKVTKQHLQDTGNVYCCFCDRLRCVQEFNCGTLQIMVTPEIWVKTVDKCGWQLYEPKEEPPKEPDYVICKRCGGSQSVPNPAVSNTAYTTCPKCGGTGYEIKEPCDAPKPAFEVGDWVEVKETIYGTITYHHVLIKNITKLSDGTFNVVFFSWYSMVFDKSITYRQYDLVNTDTTYKYQITRKLDPSEVRIKIGCLEGRVRKTATSLAFFLVPDDPQRQSLIDFYMLDTPTRELVQSLLKAQEEKQSD